MENPWNSTESMEFHGSWIPLIPWIAWIEWIAWTWNSMEFHGVHGINGIHGMSLNLLFAYYVIVNLVKSLTLGELMCCASQMQQVHQFTKRTDLPCPPAESVRLKMRSERCVQPRLCSQDGREAHTHWRLWHCEQGDRAVPGFRANNFAQFQTSCRRGVSYRQRVAWCWSET